jgi:hypothetical protein
MTAYINTETMEYPLHPGDIVEMTDNFVEVQETPMPEISNTQKAIEQQPQIIDGIWKQIWSVVDKSPEEIQFEQNLATSHIPHYQR